MKPVFLDSSAIYALADRDDDAHDEVSAHYVRCGRLVTHDGILLEAFSLINKRLNHRAALDSLGAIRQSPKIDRVPLRRSLLEASWARCVKYADKDWDWIDCTSFELMHVRGIKKALAVDKHFRQAGFQMLVNIRST